ncbi:hypothetical protein PCASD_18695 [Puccinia coronata f. sp. avenae]|uniref:Uncharacterized protein n=1 Tax=Puccinia coronata f. sp. avenae TaxID=200324 RepID=A0A2N5U0U3_9BASI|nr:hypothetical protein PCASD_18695 [Puccinia coronata f. sp. avenae]
MEELLDTSELSFSPSEHQPGSPVRRDADSWPGQQDSPETGTMIDEARPADARAAMDGLRSPLAAP